MKRETKIKIKKRDIDKKVNIKKEKKRKYKKNLIKKR